MNVSQAKASELHSPQVLQVSLHFASFVLYILLWLIIYYNIIYQEILVP